MSLLEKRKEYLANAFVLVPKLHNLHWNVVGQEFVQLHNFTEELYDEFFEKYDVIAEALKMEGVFPPVKLSEYAELASVKELESKKFSVLEVLEEVKKDLELMKELATQIRGLAEEEGHFLLVADMEGDIAGYTKHIWFLQSILG